MRFAFLLSVIVVFAGCSSEQMGPGATYDSSTTQSTLETAPPEYTARYKQSLKSKGRSTGDAIKSQQAATK